MTAKQNCWDVKNCGREQSGGNATELGVRPAADQVRCDKVNGGLNGGRICWALAGTICGGAVQGTFAQRLLNCAVCGFYQQVKREEEPSFKPAVFRAKDSCNKVCQIRGDQRMVNRLRPFIVSVKRFGGSASTECEFTDSRLGSDQPAILLPGIGRRLSEIS